jgi:hypothetical protein
MEIPTHLWNENGDICMLRADLYENQGKARYAAFIGRNLEVGFDEGGSLLTDLHVRTIYMRPSEDGERGWADEMWWYCEKDHPGAVKYYEVRC